VVVPRLRITAGVDLIAVHLRVVFEIAQARARCLSRHQFGAIRSLSLMQLADDRISTRHCRLLVHDGEWMIEDLKSTNRTFVNGEPVGERPRRLVHGDLVRLGAHDARLFEAQFVTGERSSEHRVAPQAPGDGFRKRIGELETALAARDAEVVRIGGMYKHLQSELSQHEAAAVAARRASATMTSELEGVHDELASARADHAGCRDELERAHRRCTELEAQLAAQARKARSQLDDGDRSRKELESKLSMMASELAVTKAALAAATDHVRTLKEAYDDVLLRLTNGGT
jgi:pSer/pThr/pTyr-binding forkhead associated (FHA) protein